MPILVASLLRPQFFISSHSSLAFQYALLTSTAHCKAWTQANNPVVLYLASTSDPYRRYFDRSIQSSVTNHNSPWRSFGSSAQRDCLCSSGHRGCVIVCVIAYACIASAHQATEGVNAIAHTYVYLYTCECTSVCMRLRVHLCGCAR